MSIIKKERVYIKGKKGLVTGREVLPLIDPYQDIDTSDA